MDFFGSKNVFLILQKVDFTILLFLYFLSVYLMFNNVNNNSTYNFVLELTS